MQHLLAHYKSENVTGTQSHFKMNKLAVVQTNVSFHNPLRRHATMSFWGILQEQNACLSILGPARFQEVANDMILAYLVHQQLTSSFWHSDLLLPSSKLALTRPQNPSARAFRETNVGNMSLNSAHHVFELGTSCLTDDFVMCASNLIPRWSQPKQIVSQYNNAASEHHITPRRTGERRLSERTHGLRQS